MKSKITILLLLLVNIMFSSQAQQKKIDVTYIANAGFLIENDTKQLLIDPLFKNGWDSYLIPSDSVVSKIINQEGPFSKSNLMLITHIHGDHFNASMVQEYLNNNPKNILIAPPVVANSVLENSDTKKIENQIVVPDKTNQKNNDTIIHGIKVRSFFLPHDTRLEIENLGYLVDIDGIKVFHSSDYVSTDVIEFEKLQLQNENIDLALLNYYSFWSTPEEREFVKTYINPKNIVLMHIPPAEFEIIQDSVQKINDFIDISIFKKSMKKTSFFY